MENVDLRLVENTLFTKMRDHLHKGKFRGGDDNHTYFIDIDPSEEHWADALITSINKTKGYNAEILDRPN